MCPPREAGSPAPRANAALQRASERAVRGRRVARLSVPPTTSHFGCSTCALAGWTSRQKPGTGGGGCDFFFFFFCCLPDPGKPTEWGFFFSFPFLILCSRAGSMYSTLEVDRCLPASSLVPSSPSSSSSHNIDTYIHRYNIRAAAGQATAPAATAHVRGSGSNSPSLRGLIFPRESRLPRTCEHPSAGFHFAQAWKGVSCAVLCASREVASALPSLESAHSS